ncbi:uncharacterized protein LOC106645654 [Copidosoma floridanum]|uniref:uncharacterized protein LOC106645654 n=1 Tax=Copidosoma floridanum TaxID=29053 RepID=UPI0006C9BC8F|nr:uncharacterized protein LOC106645654 [Copidosoma floridanum]
MDHPWLGWVNCRIQPRTRAERCYRCLGFGHISTRYGGPDRTGNCQVWSPTGGGRNSSQKMLILQVNLDRTVLAHDLLDQFSHAQDVDLLFINKPSRTLPGWSWYCDTAGCTAILIRSDKFSVSDTGGGDEFVCIRCGSAFYVSCYMSPNILIGTFGERLSELEDAVRVFRKSGDVVLTGNFHSKAVAWGEPRTDPKGRAVLEKAARLDLIVMNSGGSETFRRPSNQGMIIDLTLVSSEMAARVSDWQVLEDYTASYHQCVAKWNVAKLNRDLLLEAMVSAPPPADLNKITNPEEAKTLVGVRATGGPKISLTCAEKRSIYGVLHSDTKLVSKNRCWCELIAEVDKDTWGLGYRIALERLRGTDLTPRMEPFFLERVVSCLFPEHPARRLVASETLGRKAPGQDGVPSEVLKIIAVEKLHILLDMFNACLRVRLFSEQWKIQRSVCILATLDVKNAFNTAKWSNIMRALKHQNVPDYLRKILDSYLQDRVLQYDTKDGPRERRPTLGVAQESALSPDLWNLVHDELLRLEMLPGVKLTSFADDIA